MAQGTTTLVQRVGVIVSVTLVGSAVACSGDDSSDSSPPPGPGPDNGQMMPMNGGQQQSSGFSAGLGVHPDTSMGELNDSGLILACARLAEYVDANVPELDVERGLCVIEATLGQGLFTPEECDPWVNECVNQLVLPATTCVGRGPGFQCDASVAHFEACVTDYTAALKAQVDLLVCANLADPDITAKLEQASVEPEVCAGFRNLCPSLAPAPLTPPPPPPDGGAP